MSWKRLLRNRSFLASAAVLLVVAAVWGTAMAASARPKSLDERVYEVASQLQCPICQGESAADSPSGLATQMRAVIREKLQHGESEQQVIQYFVSRYGEGIRESPPLSGFTLLMWLGPVVMVLAGLWVVGSVARQWRAHEPFAATADPELDGLSEAELARYRALLEAELARDDGLAPQAEPTPGQRPAPQWEVR